MENIGNSGVSGNRITSKYTYLGNSPEFRVVLEPCEWILTPSQIPSLIKSQAAWRESSTWLGDHYLASLVQECISHLPWIRPIEASFCFTINDLSPLLSDQWLSDEHIDFLASLFGKAASDGSLSIIITTLAFSRAIPGRPQVSA